MSTLDQTLYKALTEAGVSSETAQAVKDAMKEHIEIEGGGVVRHNDLGQMKGDIAEIKTTLAVMASQIKTLSGMQTALTVAIIVGIATYVFQTLA